jgi:hypothetical protein
MTEDVKPEVKERKKSLPMYKITFHGQGGDVEIGHKFKINQYNRNVEALIDENFLQVVKDAVISTEVEDAEGKRRKVTIPTFQYTAEPV